MNSFEQARRLLTIVSLRLSESGQVDCAARLLEHVDEERVQEIIEQAAFAIASRHAGEFLDVIADQLALCAAPVG
jgi:hypothetical protein